MELSRLVRRKGDDDPNNRSQMVDPEKARELCSSGSFEDLGEIPAGTEIGSDDRFKYYYEPNGKLEIDGLPARRKAK